MTSAEPQRTPAMVTSETPVEQAPWAALPPRRPLGLVARGLTRVIGWYQIGHQDRPSPCRFVPTCSTYAREAVEAHGAVAGSLLATRRLLRCHPWGRHGFDPVPPPPSARLKRANRRV